MKKEDIILKKDDKVYYTLSGGTKNYLIVDGYAGYTIKEFEEEDSPKTTITKIERPEYKTIYETTENNNTHRSDETLQETEFRHFVDNLLTFIDFAKYINHINKD